MSTSWFDAEGNEARESLRAAVMLAKTRYNEQLASFVGNSMERLSFVHGEVDRIADETAADVGARREEVFEKLMKIIEAEVELPVSEPEHVDLDSESSGEGLPSSKFTDEAPEAQGHTDVRDHEAVLEEEILHPENSKIIPVTEGAEKVGCVRCNQRTASEGSPVCEECETELVALAADDRPPLDGLVSSDFVVGDRVVFVVDEFQGQVGTIAEDDGSGGFRVEWDIASPELPDWVQGGDLVYAKGEKAEAKVAEAMSGQPAPQQPAPLQPLNPNQPYQCIVCHFTGNYDAVVNHLNAANDSLHMQYKQDPSQAQSPATAPGTQQTGLQYQQAKIAGQFWDQIKGAIGPCPECGDGIFVKDGIASCKNGHSWTWEFYRDNYYRQFAAPQQTGPLTQGKPLNRNPLGKVAQGEEMPGEGQDEPVVVEDPTEQVSPTGKFSTIIEAMANRAAARTYSTPQDQEIQDIASQYGLTPEDVKAKLIAHAVFGDFTALNGKVGEGVVPDGYRQVEGVGGPIEAQEAIVPTNSAVRKTADDLGMEEANVYDSIREAMGADLGSEYHTEVSGEHFFYLPEDLVGAGTAPPEVPQQLPQQPAPQPAPAQQPLAKAKLAKDLAEQAARIGRRAARLERELVEGKQEV